jgi:hypothetical protein
MPQFSTGRQDLGTGAYLGSGKYHYMGAGMGFNVLWDVGELATALAKAYGVLSNYPTTAMVSEKAAFGLKHSIQVHTPIGPPRGSAYKPTQNRAYVGLAQNSDASASRAALIQDLNRRGGPKTSQMTNDFKMTAAELGKYYDAYSRASGSMKRNIEQAASAEGINLPELHKALKGAEDMGAAYEREIAKLASSRGQSAGGGGRYITNVKGRGGLVHAPGEAEGNLFQSIDVTCVGDGPNAVMMAQTLSYYGWFMEHGADRVLKPVVGTKRYYGNEVFVHAAQLGDYPYFGAMMGARNEAAGNVTLGKDGKPSGSTTFEFIMFRQQDNGHTEGFHMLEKGLDDFATKLGLQWGALAQRGLDHVWRQKRSVMEAERMIVRQLRVTGPVQTAVHAFGGGFSYRGGNPANTGQFSKRPQ